MPFGCAFYGTAFRLEPLERRRLLSSGWDIALIDKTLPAQSILERAMSAGGHVILYDSQRESPHDVLARAIGWAEASGCKIRSLSLLSHGSAGRFELGSEWISKSSLDGIAEDLGRLGRVMSQDGSINLFGCNLIDRLGNGQLLINRMSRLVNARVFASNNLTGRGGDWVLEASSYDRFGNAGAINPFSTQLLSQWPATLAAGITVTPTSGLVTTESGGTATFTVVLNNSPGGHSVSIGLTSSDLTEGTVSPATISFDNTNWNAPQTVTITGVDDLIADGSIGYTIITAPAVATGAYNGIDAADVSVTNTDNDTPGITVSPSAGLTTTEAGGTTSFSVVLNSQPAANVTVPLSSSNIAEGTISAASLTFTTANWSTPQNITITGVNDFVDDGDIAYTIVTGAATSTDANYNGINASDVAVTNTDDDTAGITVTPTSGLTTTEAGGTASFTVVLASQPTASVSIGISSSNTAEGTVSASSLTFTTANWNTPQTITVTGVDDFVDDGNIAYSIVTAAATSADTLYNGFNPSNVSVSNTDNDTAAINVSPTSGLVTTEAGGTASFTVVLASQPTANVTIGLSSSNTAEGTISVASLLFTAANWNAAQTVTVTGVDDFVDDGNIAYSIVTAAATSGDASYSGMNASDVSVSNTDNDTAGISVNPTSGLVTTEAGGTTSFTIVLDSKPTANVTIPLSSSNTAEGTVSASNVLFTAANWNTPQTVTVTGVDDFVDDGDVSYSVVTGAATSTDGVYGGLNASDVSLTNTDDDTAGITVSPTSGLTTTEAGGTATFTLVLNSKPTASVTIGISSGNTGEGTVSTSSVTFTTANWNAAQTITITGANDFIDDGDTSYSIITAAATSADANYSGRNAADVSVTNTDDDTAGITVSPTSGLTTTEAGGTASFTVVLNSQPTADVTINISSSNTAEGTIPVSSLTFTPTTWNTIQTVTVTGVNDFVDDGDIAYSIITSAASSADANYNGLNPSNVSVSNTDNDTAGITVSPTSGLTTTEAGGTSSFTIVLNSQPTADVTIALSSSNTAEGTISAASVTFTSSNWNAAQTITITGIDDAVDDGDVTYSVTTGAASSADATYNGLNPSDVSLTNIDNDTAGITVSPTSGLTTTEAGGTSSFTIVLNSKPTASVVVGIASTNTAEGTISTSSVTFTTANWNTPQTVTISGVDDFVDDGDVAYQITTAAATSADTNYNGLNPADVSVVNTDDDTAGITVTPTSGLVTTEAGGTDTFTIVLNSQPTAGVTIALSSSNTAEGTVSPASISFTTGNWNGAQTITVSGVDDLVDDGNAAYTIVTAAATSGDSNYSGRNASDVSVTNTNDDTAGITVSPTSGLTTTEAGGTATFTVVLNTKPIANVIVPLSSSNSAEGTVSTASLTFTTANWNTPQTVTVTGVDDFVDDGNIAYSIVTAAATSSDSNYGGMNPSNVSVTNTDNDTAGVTVSPTSGLVTTEAGGTDSFTVVLNSQPTANVTIDLSSSNIAEGTVSTAQLVFTPANWNVAHTVTVTGVNDDVDDDDVSYTIITAAAVSADSNYNSLAVSDVSVTNTDNDTAGVTFTPTSGLTTTEAGGTASFTVALNSQPTGNVTIGLSSSDLTEGTVSAASVTFTSANWNVAQTVTITGVDDVISDGNISYSIVTGAAVSTDPKYSGLNSADLSVTNADNDTPGITVTPVSGLTTTEAGGTAQFSVRLNTQPAADVVIGVLSSNLAEGIISASSLTFTAANWNTPQAVTITGVDDDIDDGDIAYSITTSAASSADTDYNGMAVSDVSVVNSDNDTAGVSITPTAGLVTTEAGGTASFSVALTSKPTASVSIALSSTNTAEGTLSASSITFTPANWNVAQIVTLTGQDDALDDGNIAYSITTAAVVSADLTYNGINPSDVSAVNTDDDVAGITVTPSGLITTEAGGTTSFTVVLNSQPTANVTIPISSSDTSEGTVSTASLVFTSANWNTPQTVTIIGVDDLIDDGDVSYTIVTAAATSADSNYNGMNAANVGLTNTDDDTAGITVSPTSGLVTTEAGGTASFTIVLNSQPTANVTIPLSSSNTAEGTISTSSLVFTAANWSTPQTVTITGVDDFVDDGNVSYSIITAAATSADSGYSGFNAANVSVTNIDNDTAGITVTPTSGLVTHENGASTTFTVVLNSQPTDDVSLAISSSNLTEGTLSLSSLTFTAGNWNVPQTVTITGVDDDVDDGDISYTIVTAAATSNDPNYSGGNAADVSATNIDDDTAGISVSPTSGLVTSEAGGTATFNVVLTSQPSASVTIALSSDHTGEGTVSASSLTFTPGNWNVAQTITVTGVNDFIDDGDVAYNIVTAAATSADSQYNGINPSNVALTNTDNDTAGIVVSPTSGLITTEAGGTATFTVVLSSQPTANVSIPLSSGNTGEGTLSAATLTFTSANWNVAQTVTITGVDDAVDDGDDAYSIITGAATSGDSNYSGMNAADVSVTNIDNDTAGITVTPTSGLTTTEAGGSASFTIVLTSKPTASVLVGVSSSNTAEGTIALSNLTFTAANWNTPQTVTIVGVDDDVDDGDVSYSIVTAAAVSGDPNYSGMNPADVSVTNTDNDTAGITVTPTSGLITSEAGATASFTIGLTSKPTANVTIALSSSNTAEGTLAVSSVTFTSANWNTPQTVIVTGTDDFVDDGTIAYSIITAAATSGDANYSGLNAANVSVSNTDDDTAGITVSATSGLVTTEAGGTASFTIVLNSEPTANVTIALSSSDTTEGTVSLSSMIFTPGNWNTPQTVTTTGVDDFVDDGNIVYSIITAAASSSDANYNARNASDVAISNTDDDTAGITVTPTSGLTTTEDAGTATFDIVLTSQPTANVTIALSSSNTAEGTVAPTSITFTPSDWNTPKVLTVTGVDDAVNDGDISYTIVTAAAVSADSNYSGRNPADVSVVNTDNDLAGVTVTPTSGLVTSEAGATASFTVVLNSRPTANVMIGLTSSDTTEGTISASSVTFTNSNWNTPQTVTITGVNDFVDDGDIAYSIVTNAASSSDLAYNGLNPSDVAVTNSDNDTAGFTVTPTSGLTTTEAGGTTSFTVVLNSQPAANVTVGFSSNNTAEGDVSVSQIVFTSANWNVPRTVTITGIDDDVSDGDVLYQIETDNSSSDPLYAAIDPADVSVSNLDDDLSGITIVPTSDLNTTEAGGTATFTVVLDSQPTADVNVSLSSSDLTEGTISDSLLVFTAANWYRPQTITVTGVDDLIEDGDQLFTVDSTTTSADLVYDGLTPDEVSITNSDDDVAEVVVTPITGLVTTEGGGTASFSIVLTSQPTDTVTIGLRSSKAIEGTPSTSSVVFDANNWSIPQFVTVTGVDDLIQDGNVAYTIITAPAISSDLVYSGINGANVSITNTDNDVAGIHVSPVAGLVTNENGGSDNFSVVLDTRPTANVRIAVSSSQPGEAVASVSKLIFTPANWNVPQIVTVTGVADHIVDPDRSFSIVLAPAVSGDLHYDGMNPADVAGTNLNRDVAGIIVTPTTGLVTRETGGGDVFSVVLRSKPAANVTVPIQSSDTTEGVVSDASITFTPADWDIAQQITVSGVDDLLPDGDVSYKAILAPAASGDSNYAGLDAADVSLVNVDNDTIGISVTPITISTTRETGTAVGIYVVLTKQPTASVTLRLASSNPAEGIVSQPSLTFTPENWETRRKISVIGVNDVVDDGDRSYDLIVSVLSSADTDYAALPPKRLTLLNKDDDTSGVTVAPVKKSVTTESGGAARFDVVLNTQPFADVFLTVITKDKTEGRLGSQPIALHFTPDDWNKPHRMIVRGIDDHIVDGDQQYRVLLAPAAGTKDRRYARLVPTLIHLTNIDDDVIGVKITPIGKPRTSESGDDAKFDIALTSQPSAPVSLRFNSRNRNEGILDSRTITLHFTPTNWNVPQRLTVHGVDDQIDDGDVLYRVLVRPGLDNVDRSYAQLTPVSIYLTNLHR